MTALSALTDLPTPVQTDYLVGYRGTTFYRIGLDKIPYQHPASGFFGMGIASASAKARLHVVHTNSTDNAPSPGTGKGPLALSNADPSYGLSVGVATDGHTWFQSQRFDTGTGVYSITFQEAGGNVGFGTATPTTDVELNRSRSGGATIMKVSNPTTGAGSQARYDMATGTANAYAIVGLQDNAGSPYTFYSRGAAVQTHYDDVNIHYWRNNAGSTKMALDSSSNVNIFGQICQINNGKMLMQHDGTHAYFRTTIAASNLYLGAAGSNTWVVDNDGSFHPLNDNSWPIGKASARMSVVYAGTGTINTSDEREKTWRGAATDKELAAAREIIDELGFFQWNDAVEAKGGDARLHYGVRAQRVWAIMAAHGLVDPIVDDKPGKTPYAFLCYDVWEDKFEDVHDYKTVKVPVKVPVKVDTGLVDAQGQPVLRDDFEETEVEEQQWLPTGEKKLVQAAGNRFGVRTDQLTLFLIAAQEQRLKNLEAAVRGK